MPGITMEFSDSVLIAFALSFSSTVFAIQVMQSRGEMSSRHANLSIGVLLLQDIAAVIFIAGSTGKVPDRTALLLLLLIPARPLIIRLLKLAGHDELFTLFGLALALLGADLFELVGVKGDLGALILGAMLANDRKGKELAKNLLQFKDLFLVGFFISIGLSGWPAEELVYVALLIGVLAPLKSPLYFWLMTRFSTPPRTAVLSAAALSNYSEFGLIVVAIASKEGMLDYQWSAALSLSIALSFLLSSGMNLKAHSFYMRHFNKLRRFKRRTLETDLPDISDARVIVLGMGNIGSGAYSTCAAATVMKCSASMTMTASWRCVVRAVNAWWAPTPVTQCSGRSSISTQGRAGAAGADQPPGEHAGGQAAAWAVGYNGFITAIVRFDDEAEDLARYNIASFNLFAEAGMGFAAHADLRHSGAG